MVKLFILLTAEVRPPRTRESPSEPRRMLPHHGRGAVSSLCPLPAPAVSGEHDGFLKSWKAKVMGQRPTSILVISGHWETHEPTVNVVPQNDTIYDFYGFPKPMYEFKYPAPGAPELAKRVKELLMASNFKCVNEDKERRLDHGAWVPLMLMYPEADIPVCQLSVRTNRDGSYHYNMGKALAPLREEGVLIFGSGSATHNLRALDLNSEAVVPWAYEFDTWLKNALLDGRYEDVNHYEEKAPHARKAHPWPDHFYPLHVAMGAAGKDAKAKLIHHGWSFGTLLCLLPAYNNSQLKFASSNHANFQSFLGE